MAGLSLDHPWAFAFGILGNVISFMVYLAPIPTFNRIYRKKSTEGFQSVPVRHRNHIHYDVHHVCHKEFQDLHCQNNLPRRCGTVWFDSYRNEPLRRRIQTFTLLGWICVGFSVSVFVAPLSIISVVIRTKSVEFMPFSLSFFLTLSAVAWFSYGLFTKDIYVAIPNTFGFAFGVAQMVLYVIYMDRGQKATEKKGTTVEHIVDISKVGSTPDLELQDFPES